MRNNVMTARDINNTNTRLKAFPPRSPPSHHLANAGFRGAARQLRSAQQIHHLPCKSPDSLGNLLARPASLKIQPIQWGGDGGYLGYQTPANYAGTISATGSNAAQDEGYAFPPVAPTAPNGVSKTAGALIAAR